MDPKSEAPRAYFSKRSGGTHPRECQNECKTRGNLRIMRQRHLGYTFHPPRECRNACNCVCVCVVCRGVCVCCVFSRVCVCAVCCVLIVVLCAVSSCMLCCVLSLLCFGACVLCVLCCVVYVLCVVCGRGLREGRMVTRRRTL